MLNIAQHGHAPPVINCGVYLFSVRIYEEFGLSSYSTLSEDVNPLRHDTSSNVTPRNSSTPKGHVSSSGGSDIGKTNQMPQQSIPG